MEDVSLGGTRERILKAAEVLFADRGYAGTRLHEIAHSVGVQKASLFHHFASKDDLYRAVLAYGYYETQLTIQKALEGAASPLEKIRGLTEAYVDMVVAHPERTKILLRQSLGDAPPGSWTEEAQRIFGIVVDFVENWQREVGGPPVDAHAVLVGVVGMVAFFFTSAPVLAPDWFPHPLQADNVARVKRHVTSVVESCLAASLTMHASAPTKAVAT
ncbi:MAG: TetR/AcrR family transcriptional regulator [Deltaproteobacteria bacterium]|nr:TetR/AcrR family transcriptional regulator [Deltaproteobacteria bacterium]